MRTKALDLLTQLKRFIHARVIKSPQLQQTRFKGQQMIIQLFAYFHRDPQHLLPSSIGREFNAAEGDSAKQRVICDYLASMRSEEHTSELKSLMRISYAVFCLNKKQSSNTHN